MKADKSNFYGNNKNLKGYARDLRQNMTKAEACLWKYALKARKRKGYQFRRQRPIHRFIADFMCKELKLIIEVDGISHSWEKTVEKDREKEKELKEAGFYLLRFEDAEVLNDIDSVALKIDETIVKLENS